MASLRQIRQRIKSIQNSRQIMRAMQLVSGSKLKRTQNKLVQAREGMEFLNSLLQRVLASLKDPSAQRRASAKSRRRSRKSESVLDHPLCAARGTGESLLAIFTSDAGLCGSYNTNLIHLAEAHLRRDSARPTQIVFIGKKGFRYFTKRGYHAVESYIDLAGRPNAAKAEAIGQALMARFLSGQVSSVKLLYSRFVSATVYKPTIQAWLPIKLDEAPAARAAAGAKASATLDYLFEPSAEAVFADLLPRWALTTFQLVMLEAFTSEHSARMLAMKNATDNASEILGSLTTQRNKIRQAAITKELSEIVGTAEALK